MWAIINIGGASNSRHHHGNSDISGAYYVRAPKNCGEIVFYDQGLHSIFSSIINKTKQFECYTEFSKSCGRRIGSLSKLLRSFSEPKYQQ